MKTCENCIFAHRYPKAEDPGFLGEQPVTAWQKFWGINDYKDVAELRSWNRQHDAYINYVVYRRCKRFPKEERKHKNDFCGEHQTS